MTDEQLFLSMMRCFRTARRTPPPPDAPGMPVPSPDAPAPGQNPPRPMGYMPILDILHQHSPMSQKDIATALSITPQSVSEALASLEKDGFILKQVNAQDRRGFLISITAAGIQRLDIMFERRRAKAEHFLSVLTPDEKETLFELVSKLLSANTPPDGTAPDTMETAPPDGTAP